MKHDTQALLDIRNEMQFLIENVTDQTDVSDDPVRSRAVARSLQIIGDATKRISEDMREKHPDIPWKAMAGMRDTIVHEYDEIDPEQVWQTVQRDIPKTLPKIELLLEAKL